MLKIAVESRNILLTTNNTVCKLKKQSKTDSHWVDWAVDSQSEAAVSVYKKRQPITAEQPKPHWLLKMRQTNQYTESYELIKIKMHNYIGCVIMK